MFWLMLLLLEMFCASDGAGDGVSFVLMAGAAVFTGDAGIGTQPLPTIG